MGQNRFVTEKEKAGGVSVLKDRNFIGRSLKIGADSRARLLGQLRRDVKFLEDHDRIDYSLLLGVASVHAVNQEPQHWPTPDCHGLPSSSAKGTANLQNGRGVCSSEKDIAFSGQSGGCQMSSSSSLAPPSGSLGYAPSTRPSADLDRLSSLQPTNLSSASGESSMKTGMGYPAVHVGSSAASLQPPQASDSHSPSSRGLGIGRPDKSSRSSSEDAVVYFMGIIDILEEYTVKKALEGAAKTIRWQATHMRGKDRKRTLANTSNAISACSASHYAQRFLDFLDSKME